MYSDVKCLDDAPFQIVTSLIFSSCLVFFWAAFKYLLCMVLWCFIEYTLNSLCLLRSATPATCVRVEEGLLDLFTWHHIGICKDSVSRGASLDERWSPPLIWKRHLRSHPDFPLEDRATACPRTVPINPDLVPNNSSCLVFFWSAVKYRLCLVLWCFIKCTQILNNGGFVDNDIMLGHTALTRT